MSPTHHIAGDQLVDEAEVLVAVDLPVLQEFEVCVAHNLSEDITHVRICRKTISLKHIIIKM